MKSKMIRNFKLTVIAVLAAVGLTGCGNRIPDMTAEQSRQIGEYAAVTLLKYDANHRSRLVDAEKVAAYEQKQQKLRELEEQQKTPETAGEGMKPTEDTPTVELEQDTTSQGTGMSLGESLSVPEGIGVTYQGYKICTTYPDDGSADDYFALDASAGKKFLVLEFLAENTGAAEQRVDFFSATAVYSVNIGNGTKENAITTMLLNDLSTYMGTIPAGGSQNLVLLFEIDENTADSITDMQLQFRNDAGTSTIQL